MNEPASARLVLERIRKLLDENHAAYRELHHEPTRTSADAARVRDEDLRVGGKALLMKVDNVFALFVLPADRRVDSAAVRRALGARKLRFAAPDELFEHTGLQPGAVPPFGHPILPVSLYLDEAIAKNDRIAFNAGSLTDSIILDIDDYQRIARPQRVLPFSRSD